MSLTKLYARLLRLYPQDFYDRFGDDMLAVLAEAQQARQRGLRAATFFALHELFGLCRSIGQEHWQQWQHPFKRRLFNWRFVPVWLLAVSFALASVWQVSYWGYYVKPSSTFGAMATIDSILLAEFGDDYRPTRIPLNELPWLVTPDFPPSQILTQIYRAQANADVADSFDAALAEALVIALEAEAVSLGHRDEYPVEPVLNFRNCELCFLEGIQPQPDGSLLQIIPEISTDGSYTGANTEHRITANEWWYYRYFTPAGYIVQGQAADGTPLVFVGIASRTGGDRHLYSERLFDASGEALIVRDQIDYRFDISGLEGINAPVVTVALFVPLLLLWLMLVALVWMYVAIKRRVGRRGHYNRA